jgi:hypothetical protein
LLNESTNEISKKAYSNIHKVKDNSLHSLSEIIKDMVYMLRHSPNAKRINNYIFSKRYDNENKMKSTDDAMLLNEAVNSLYDECAAVHMHGEILYQLYITI